MASAPTAADRSLLKEQAYCRIKEQIQSAKFPAGAFLSERQLSALLGMSKTPIKAALERLEHEGLVSGMALASDVAQIADEPIVRVGEGPLSRLTRRAQGAHQLVVQPARAPVHSVSGHRRHPGRALR